MIKKYPQHHLAKQSRFRLASALYESQKYEESAQTFKEFSKSGSGEALAADALFNQALAWSRAKNDPLTLKSYEELLRRFPRYPKQEWIWLQVALLQEEAGQWRKAIDAYTHVLNNREERLQAQLAIGRCYEKLKNIPLAMKAYEKLLSLQPKNDSRRLSGLARLGLLYEIKKQQNKALNIYVEVSHYPLEATLAKLVQQRMQFILRRQEEISKAN
ncbi:MAG: tetratricopeptide repeat protein [Elusimicrobia bacterium]|nr:tetratricopeptide repeat protein [Elusimicrobiota bacterium]